ncbi:Receptor serine/threonine kinase [Tripterygium wilfordii]|uniref:Receptor serine/threonine kinase n=2 Tax=Tripterygium wilfordii TaxID=458696 RepID=A0A7J7CN48_TRIWF|nr:Receptor serine/threonine kinase [Tripterygium wilfordii]
MVLADGGIEEKDMVKGKIMTMLALWCVQYLPQARPSMSDVVKILEGEAQVTIPPNPFQHLIDAGGQKIASFIESHSTSRTDDPTVDEKREYTTIMKKYEIEYAASTC